MHTTDVPQNNSHGTWRRWFRRLREFEDAMTMTEVDVLGARIAAVEREQQRLRSLLGDRAGLPPVAREVTHEPA